MGGEVEPRRMAAHVVHADIPDARLRKGVSQRLKRHVARRGQQQRQAHALRRAAQHLDAQPMQRCVDGLAPTVDDHGADQHVARGGFRQRLGDHEDGHACGMVGPLHEGQAGDDLGGVLARKRAPPGGVRRPALDAHHAQIPLRGGDARNHGGGAVVNDEGNGEAEMEAHGIAHGGVARRHICVDGIIRLHPGEGGDDDPPDALHRLQRQQAFVTERHGAHHGGLAPRAEGRAAALFFLDGDQRVDDAAALDQQLVHGRIDPVDVDAQAGQQVFGARLSHCVSARRQESASV